MLKGVPQWVFDWSGSACVVMSLIYLFRKLLPYWHWSNASVVPYTVLYLRDKLWLLVGLQLCFLVFGLHGLYVWFAERRRTRTEQPFNDVLWYRIGWMLVLAIFAYTVWITDFVDKWAWLLFVITSASLVANWATTRKWVWSWPAWMAINVLQVIYYAHVRYWGLFYLQFVLFAMSIYGWREWHRERASLKSGRELFGSVR